MTTPDGETDGVPLAVRKARMQVTDRSRQPRSASRSAA